MRMLRAQSGQFVRQLTGREGWMTILATTGRRPHQPVTRRHGGGQGVIDLSLLQEGLGMTGHHTCFRMGKVLRCYQGQAMQPHIVHRTGGRPDVPRGLRPYQNDRDVCGVWPYAHWMCRLW